MTSTIYLLHRQRYLWGGIIIFAIFCCTAIAYSIPPSTKTLETWIWKAPDTLSEDEMQEITRKAQEEKFTSITITIDDILTFKHLPTPERERREDAFIESLTRFIARAHAQGLTVDVEAGKRDWIQTAKRGDALAILEFVSRYTALHPGMIRAVQYDIEPYLLDEYEKNKTAVLKSFIELVDILEKRAAEKHIRLSIVLPHFYDAAKDWTPRITYSGIRDYTFNHAVRILNRTDGNMIIIMAYRNTLGGDDGSIALSQEEIEYTRDHAKKVKILIAQETGDVEPDYVTFYGKSKQELLEHIEKIRATFSKESSFGGVAVHYFDTYLNLE